MITAANECCAWVVATTNTNHNKLYDCLIILNVTVTLTKLQELTDFLKVKKGPIYDFHGSFFFVEISNPRINWIVS